MNENLKFWKCRWTDLYLREGGGEQTRVPGENPHQPIRTAVLEVKIHRPNQGSNPHPLTLVISLLGQNGLAPTHWTIQNKTLRQAMAGQVEIYGNSEYQWWTDQTRIRVRRAAVGHQRIASSRGLCEYKTNTQQINGHWAPARVKRFTVGWHIAPSTCRQLCQHQR